MSFVKSFEKKAAPGIIRQFGTAIKDQVTGKLNMGFNALGVIDQAKDVSQQMKRPLGSPRMKT